MPRHEFTVDCPLFDSFRVRQVAGMFDLPLAEKLTQSFAAEIPDLEEGWSIGLIVGPSGSGKSTLARLAFGEAVYDHPAWPLDRAVIDCLGELPTRQLAGLLTAVGFSSPPGWIKPYRVLSGGERFRCDLARALAAQQPLVVFDEFTSVVDRQVAQVGSAAIAKAIRSGQIDRRFVAVSCHDDIVDWLAPDWVCDLGTGTLSRRQLRRPTLELDLFRCRREAWARFAPHHYLSGKLHPSARCYLASFREQPVSFCATLPLFGRRASRRISRIVTLPEFQGVGIGMRVAEAIAQLESDAGYRVSVTASHPALVSHCQRSPLWRTVRVVKSRFGRRRWKVYQGAIGRPTVTFAYRPAASC